MAKKKTTFPRYIILNGRSAGHVANGVYFDVDTMDFCKGEYRGMLYTLEGKPIARGVNIRADGNAVIIRQHIQLDDVSRAIKQAAQNSARKAAGHPVCKRDIFMTRAHGE